MTGDRVQQVLYPVTGYDRLATSFKAVGKAAYCSCGLYEQKSVGVVVKQSYDFRNCL